MYIHIRFFHVKVQGLDVDTTVQSAKNHLASDPGISPGLRQTIELLLMLVTVLVNAITLNSKNSSKPPSSDPNRKKKSKKGKSSRKPGGQAGHPGVTLTKVDDPDEIVELYVDKRFLSKGVSYRVAGFESRQVIDIEVTQVVTEYRAQILKDTMGNQVVAEFPQGITRPIQYGSNIKANAVYMSHYQMVPYDRIVDNFQDQLDLPISSGSLFNFNQQAYELLENFETWAKKQLINADVMHADETGINIASKNHWLHCASTSKVTLFYPHQKRGKEAMDQMGILPFFTGVLCHDHWKPYYQYNCIHALCNAHHLRELERAHEQDGQQWALEMNQFLLDANTATTEAGGKLDDESIQKQQEQYRNILENADIECPAPERQDGHKGRLKRSKSRNLLERLRDFECDVLRFMHTILVPFTNNQGENDLRMTKVQQKISGCFRSFQGAEIFCRVRSFIVTARKHGVSPTTALRLLFEGHFPDFMLDSS